MLALLGAVLLALITLNIGMGDGRHLVSTLQPSPETGFRLLQAHAFGVLGPPSSRPGSLVLMQKPIQHPDPSGCQEPAGPEAAEPRPPVIPAKAKKLSAVIKNCARRYGLEEKLVLAVIHHESGFKSGAVSPDGARGLMQLMPETAAHLGVKNPLDARQNIAGGVKFLRICLNRFNQDVGLALAAYNAGPGNVEKYEGCPPFPETRRFVRSVMERCYGEDWRKNTRITLPNPAPLARAETG